MEATMKEIVLEDLVRINKECSKTLQELMKKEPMLASFFQHLVDLERECLLQLRQQMVRSHGDPAGKVERKGDIYQLWAESGSGIPSGKNSEACSLCEKKLNDLILAYNEAIKKGTELSDHLITMLQGQIDKVKDGFQMLLRRSSELSQARKKMAV